MSTTLPILVVAPNDQLRRSIEFALEAEGFGVVSHALLPAANGSLGRGHYACLVVDEEAVTPSAPTWEKLASFAGPVVLLVDKLRAGPEGKAMTLLHKPLLGRSLTETVTGAVARNGYAT